MPGFAGGPASTRRPHRRFRATKHIIPQSSEIARGVQLYYVEKQPLLRDGAQEKSAKNVFRSKMGVFHRRTNCNNNTFFGRIWNPPLRPYITKNPRTFVRGFWCGYGIFPRPPCSNPLHRKTKEKAPSLSWIFAVRMKGFSRGLTKAPPGLWLRTAVRRPVQILFTAKPKKKLQA